MIKNRLKLIISTLLLTIVASLNSCAVKVGNPDDGGQESDKYKKEKAISQENYSDNENIIENQALNWNLSCTEAKLSSATLAKFGCGLIDSDGNNKAITQIDEDITLVLKSETEDKVEASITKDEEDLYFPFKVELEADNTDDIVEYLDTMLVTIKAAD